MEIISASSEDVQSVYKDIMETRRAKQRRQELSEESFRVWLYGIISAIFDELGYQLESFEQFWIGIGRAVATGFSDGRARAREEARRDREEWERRYR